MLVAYGPLFQRQGARCASQPALRSVANVHKGEALRLRPLLFVLCWPAMGTNRGKPDRLPTWLSKLGVKGGTDDAAAASGGGGGGSGDVDDVAMIGSALWKVHR